MSLTQSQLSFFTQLLREEIADLERVLDDFATATAAVELDQNRVGRLSRMDAMQGQAMAQAGQARQQTRLANLKAALVRLANGDFGRCEECDEWVALARLQLDPSHRLCITCAQLNES